MWTRFPEAASVTYTAAKKLDPNTRAQYPVALMSSFYLIFFRLICQLSWRIALRALCDE